VPEVHNPALKAREGKPVVEIAREHGPDSLDTLRKAYNRPLDSLLSKNFSGRKPSVRQERDAAGREEKYDRGRVQTWRGGQSRRRVQGILPFHYKGGMALEDALRCGQLSRKQVAILWLIRSEGEQAKRMRHALGIVFHFVLLCLPSQAPAGGLLPHRSNLFKSHWSNQWLTLLLS
jgi:hypothetical protein